MTGRRTRDREPSKELDGTGLGPRLTPRQARGSSSCPEPSVACVVHHRGKSCESPRAAPHCVAFAGTRAKANTVELAITLMAEGTSGSLSPRGRAAFAPMRIVSGPSSRVTSWKFLNRLRRMDSITVRNSRGVNGRYTGSRPYSGHHRGQHGSSSRQIKQHHLGRLIGLEP